MITVTFKTNGNLICGFTVSGHSDYAQEGSDIVCAAVSSAVIMSANTITEVQHINADVTESDGFVNLNLSTKIAHGTSKILIPEVTEAQNNNIKNKLKIEKILFLQKQWTSIMTA